MHGELVWFNVLLATALGDEALRERGTFSVSQHPANHVAGEDVEDDVEVVVGPLDGATKLRYIPRPNLVGLCLLFIHPRAPNLINLRSAGTMPA